MLVRQDEYERKGRAFFHVNVIEKIEARKITFIIITVCPVLLLVIVLVDTL